jgi:hypothetical protein
MDRTEVALSVNSEDAEEQSLLRVLFGSGERWGWEWRDVEKLSVPFAKPSPEEPEWVQEPTPKSSGPAVTYRRWKRWLWLLIPGVFVGAFIPQLVFFGANPTGATKTVAGFMDVGLWIAGYTWLFLRTRALRRAGREDQRQSPGFDAFRERRRQMVAEHDAAIGAWNREAEQYSEHERRRVDELPAWGAVRPTTPSRRIDIYGGTIEGWQAFTTTLGSSLLGSGQSLSVLDLSEADAAALLFRASRDAGVPTMVNVLPQAAEHLDLFAGLNYTAVKDLLVEALHSDQPQADRGDMSIDDRILNSICEVLAPTLTIERINSALAVLLRQEPGSAGKPEVLTEAEWSSISELFNDEFRSVIVANLVRLEAQLSPLRDLGRHARATPSVDGVRCEGVAIARTGGALFNQLLVDVLIQRTIHQLRGTAGNSPQVVMIIAADLLKARHIEKLDELASMQGIRVVYLFRHLRGDVLDVVGGGGAIAGVMRPGSPQEAEQAAALIGRTYEFVLTQRSRSLGSTWTSNWGESESYGGMPTKSINWGGSKARSQEEGTTEGRVHEYKVEPEELRLLPPTVLFLVESTPAGHRRGLRIADCNPSLATYPRVSSLPFSGQAS